MASNPCHNHEKRFYKPLESRIVNHKMYHTGYSPVTPAPGDGHGMYVCMRVGLKPQPAPVGVVGGVVGNGWH